MSKFFDAIEDRTTTENGAVTYSTSKNDNLDFFALAGAKRNCPEEAVELFKKAFYEDYDLALKNLFYLRDVRHGKGERKVFQECMKHLCDVFAPELITAYKESKINRRLKAKEELVSREERVRKVIHLMVKNRTVFSV